MIKILIVDDNQSKQEKIKGTILDNHGIDNSDIYIACCTKDARKFLQNQYYDLMILDLVLPVEVGEECSATNGVRFLNEIGISPFIKPPIHIVGVSGFKDKVLEHNDDFRMRLWNLIEYEENSTAWQEQLNSIIFHLVKTRQQFLGASIGEKISVYMKEVEDMNIPNTFIGADWKTVSGNLMTIVERALLVPEKFSNGAKAKNINSGSIKITSEYDFQNLVHIVLRPWIPSVEAENIAVVFDGNTKNADFSIKGNSIIVEAKYIDTTGKKNDTLKTLDGLKNFYSMNANVKLLMFMILVEENVAIDVHKIESEYSQLNENPMIVVKIFKNTLKK